MAARTRGSGGVVALWSRSITRGPYSTPHARKLTGGARPGMIRALSNLATMLQRAGLLPEEIAARVREFAHANKVPLVEVVVDRGVLTEEELVKFLQSKLMIPEVEADLLGELERETLRHLPAELAWYHEVLPVSVDDVGNLTLAMADPTDLRAVDAVAGHTGAYLVRAVAPLTALRRALERYYGPRPEDLRTRITSDPTPATGTAVPPQAVPAPAEPPSPEVASSPEAPSTPPPAEPAAATPSSEPPPVRPAPPVRAGPGTVRRDTLRPPSDEVVPPLSPVAFARVLPRLVAAADRDEITQVLLDFLAEGFSRVIMFVHLQQQLRGRDARGDDLLLEAVTQVRIPTTGPSLFRDVIERGAPHFGPWRTDTKINAAFAQAMGGITGNVLLLPVKLRERVPILVYASNTPHPVDPRSLHELVDGISGALERLIFRRKSLDNLPKQG
jgi:hypothetical protein